MGILRFLLALAVIIAHSTPILGLTFGGGVAVPCFFVISGFYMGLILSEKYVGQNSSYYLFISNRSLRLYPIYFVILVATLAANFCIYYLYGANGSPKIGLILELFKQNQMPHSGFALYCFSSVFLIFQDLINSIGINRENNTLFFLTSALNKNVLPLGYFNFVPQAWSLGSEILFYIFAPFLVKRSNWLLFIIVILSVVFRIVLFKNGLQYDLWYQLLFPSVLVFFILGIFSYRFYKIVFFKWKYTIKAKKYSFLSLPILVTALISYQWINFSYQNFLYPIFIACMIPFLFNFSKNLKWDTLIGELSYPMYISHLLISMILNKLMPDPSYHTGLVLSILTILASFLLNRFVSKPIERYRQKRVKKSNKVHVIQ